MAFEKKRFDVDIRLSDEAIDWVVKLSSGRATPQDRNEFELWRQRSNDHELAALEAESLWNGIGSSGHDIRSRERRTKFTRRTVLGAALIGVAGISIHQLSIARSRLYADYITGTSEQKTLRLADGSTVIMNGNTALSVQLLPHERRLFLFEGQAIFEVAKDVARPFIVEANNGQTRAVGTEFDIDMRSGHVVVTVTEGMVQVSNLSPALNQNIDGVFVRANQRVLYDASGTPSEAEEIDASAETAWRRGKLIFNAKPLGEVVEALARYRSEKIFIVNGQLNALEVTGVFDLSQPNSVLESIEATLPVSITRLPFVTILR